MSPRVMTDLSALIVALEGATEASKRLDWMIAEAIGLVPKHRIKPVGWDYYWYRRSETEYALWKAEDAEGRTSSLWQAKPYTSSIDAALTLGRSSAEKFRMLEAVFRADYPADEARHLFIACKAIVLAALKARQASSTHSDQSPVPQNTGHDR